MVWPYESRWAFILNLIFCLLLSLWWSIITNPSFFALSVASSYRLCTYSAFSLDFGIAFPSVFCRDWDISLISLWKRLLFIVLIVFTSQKWGWGWWGLTCGMGLSYKRHFPRLFMVVGDLFFTTFVTLLMSNSFLMERSFSMRLTHQWKKLVFFYLFDWWMEGFS